jgi:23S rRNA (cytidine1920-2'-O)/16S rRNA (cytidine1409-2'-O)-methyltransferase
MPEFVSRGGVKLDHALTAFAVDVSGKICADLGCSTGGFTDCLLQRGAGKVYAIDTGYGVLEWKLRKDSRVVVMERTNAMHVQLPETMNLVVIDAGWTRQRNILPNARRMVASDGVVIALVKPHYESEPSQLRDGVVAEDRIAGIMETVRRDAEGCGFEWMGEVRSPIKGRGGNVEMLVRFRPSSSSE